MVIILFIIYRRIKINKWQRFRQTESIFRRFTCQPIPCYTCKSIQIEYYLTRREEFYTEKKTTTVKTVQKPKSVTRRHISNFFLVLEQVIQ